MRKSLLFIPLLLIITSLAIARDFWDFPNVTALSDDSEVMVYDPALPIDDIDRQVRNITWGTMRQIFNNDSTAVRFDRYTAIARVTDTDPRLSDPRPPLAHDQAVSTITGLQTSLNAKANTTDLAAVNISYTNPTYTTVAAALNQLLYVAPGSPVVSGGGTYETGQTISSVILNWTITLGSAPLTSQSIDNGIGSISTALRTYTHSGQSITNNRSYIVSISDGTTPRTGTTTVSFQRRNHYAASTIPLAAFTSANILSMASNVFASSHALTNTYDCTGGRYPTFAFPTSYGLLTTTIVGGLSFSDYSYRTISHTNASGSVTNYYVYQFNSLQNGAAIAVVWH